MLDYCSKIFLAHLEKAPQYKFPTESQRLSGMVDLLRPSIVAVELRHHGNETAVALEGSNLWFCYQISVGSHSVPTPPQDLSGTSIQFNVPDGKRIAAEGGKVQVTVKNHFLKPSTKEVSAIEKKVLIY